MLSLLISMAIAMAVSHSDAQPNPSEFQVHFQNEGKLDLVDSLAISALYKKKSTVFSEKLPQESEATSFKGLNLSHLIEEWIKKLPPDRRATIDLVLLKQEGGGEVLIPRSFFVKYPVYLVFGKKAEGDLAEDEKPLRIVLPWSSKPRMKDENLPLEKYFAKKVTGVEFTNYRARVGWAYLEKKSEPAVLRGERLFVQNCLTCHGATSNFATEKIKAIEGKAHPLQTEFKFDAAHSRAIQLYWQALQKQKAGPSS